MMVMGANYRSQFHPKVVGVTGSVGKTTTKQMTYAAIAGFGNTIKTEGNQNNELGLPRTIFRIGRDTEYAVVEMGMSHAGEIERLAKCARPDVGIITCIGVSHIGNLGSQENICKAKLEICAGLAEGSPLVLNGDDPFLRKAALPAHVRPVWFSLGDENADVCALDVRQEGDGMAFTLCDKNAGRYAVTIRPWAVTMWRTRWPLTPPPPVWASRPRASSRVWPISSRPVCARRWSTQAAWTSSRTATTPTPTA